MKRTLCSKYFWFSFLLSLSLILAGAAALTVDYRCRKALTGDDSALFSVVEKGREVSLSVNAMGVRECRDITALHRLWEKFCDLICIPHN